MAAVYVPPSPSHQQAPPPQQQQQQKQKQQQSPSVGPTTMSDRRQQQQLQLQQQQQQRRRRAPLSNVPNGTNTNSPFRRAAAGGLIQPSLKRSRPADGIQLENVYPPEIIRKQMITSNTTANVDVNANGCPEHREDYPRPNPRVDSHTTTASTSMTTTNIAAPTSTMTSNTHQFHAPPPSKQATSRRSTTTAATGVVVGGNAAEKARLFTLPSKNAVPTDFERKLVASREQSRLDASALSNSRRQPVGGGNGNGNGSGNGLTAAERAARIRHNRKTLENLRAWQSHYKKAFPTFVFYFDGLPDELRNKCARQIHLLGAKEEKFFSRAVTHVVTTRPIPPEIDANKDTKQNDSKHEASTSAAAQALPTTVNPSVLERTRDGRATDVLHRAREMHMKIWAYEKVQRVIGTINDPAHALMAASGIYQSQSNTTTSASAAAATAAVNTTTAASKRNRTTDLSLALQHEKLVSSTDPAAREIVPFKGPYIYVHCALGNYRPIIIKEYPKVARKSAGSWPQFRSAMAGKCPFIEDPGASAQTPRELEKKNLVRAQQLEIEKKRLSRIGNGKGKEKEKKAEEKRAGKANKKVTAADDAAWEKYNSDELVNSEHYEIVSRYQHEHGRLPEGGVKALRPLPRDPGEEQQRQQEKQKQKEEEEEGEEYDLLFHQIKKINRMALSYSVNTTQFGCAFLEKMQAEDDQCAAEGLRQMTPARRAAIDKTVRDTKAHVKEVMAEIHALGSDEEENGDEEVVVEKNNKKRSAAAADGNDQKDNEGSLQQDENKRLKRNDDRHDDDRDDASAPKPQGQENTLKRPAPADDGEDDDMTPRFLKPTSNHLLERLATQNKSLGLHGLSKTREPAASGVQPSNVTSAIRSQMISSTAAGMGAKAATSKEVHELKRKVLENNIHGALAGAGGSNRSTTSSHYAPGSLLEAKLKGVIDTKEVGQEKMVGTQGSRGGNNSRYERGRGEDGIGLDKSGTVRGGRQSAATGGLSKKAIPTPVGSAAVKEKEKKRDPKPGYCENCRDKFDDFDEHITSRKHRKFAMTADNWVELDEILEYIHSEQYQRMAQRSVTSWDPSDDENDH